MRSRAAGAIARRPRARAAATSVVSPMQGTVLDVKVATGDVVEVGQVICIVEAMKMENEVVAHKAGVVADVAVATGAAVTNGQAICAIETPE